MNTTTDIKVEIADLEVLPDIIRRVLGKLSDVQIANVIDSWITLRNDYPGLRMVGARSINDSGEIVAAAYLCEYPGTLGVLMGPWVSTAVQSIVDDPGVRCVRLLLEVGRTWGVELIQALSHRSLSKTNAPGSLVTSAEVDDEALLRMRLEASGMQRLTLLNHLVLDLNTTNCTQADVFLINNKSTSLQWNRFRRKNLEQWVAWLNGTYVDTLDCPELNGVRSPAMTLEGYWSMAGVPQPNSLLRDSTACNQVEVHEEYSDEMQFAVRLKESNIEWWGLPAVDVRKKSSATITKHSDYAIAAGFFLSQTSHEHWELTYMGVHEDFRGSGLGKLCLACAIQRCAELGGVSLSLAVDVRNTVCIELYNSFGFRPTSEIEAWIFTPSNCI